MCLACIIHQYAGLAIVATSALIGALLAKQVHPLAAPLGAICGIGLIFLIVDRYNKKE